MTIYEQIQRTLNYIERNLFHPIKQEDVVKEAGMSARSLQHYFWMVTGYSYKEYLVKRRLTVAKTELLSSNKQIVEIALDIGYLNHESFTRAFKSEFNVSPKKLRQHRLCPDGLERIELFKEIYMGIVVKELPELLTVTFTGFSSEPEMESKEKLQRWIKMNPTKTVPRRIFGHNIDRSGNLENNPDNTGYKFYATIVTEQEGQGADIEIVKKGKFLVTGIEGNFIDDPSGIFIRKGWIKMDNMIKEKGYKLKEKGRWFEEELEPQKEGNLRLDLYIEIEQ